MAQKGEEQQPASQGYVNLFTSSAASQVLGSAKCVGRRKLTVEGRQMPVEELLTCQCNRREWACSAYPGGG